MTEFAGSDELTDAELADVDSDIAGFTEMLNKRVSEATSVRSNLNSTEGMAFRRQLTVRKRNAQNSLANACVAGNLKDIDGFTKEYAVLQEVEAIFAGILIGGDEAFKALEQSIYEPDSIEGPTR